MPCCKFPSISHEALGLRHVQYLLIFLAIVVDYCIRNCMALAIIAMLEPSPHNPNIPTYPEWTKKSTILSSFFWGYVIPQIGAGELTKHVSPKWVLGVTMFINALFTILVPVFASTTGETGVIICRVIQGLCQGFLYPSFHSLIGKWAPFSERSRAVSFCYTGAHIGLVITMVSTGLLSSSSAGWPAVFYLFGSLGFVWVILWMWMAADSPSKHPKISDKEKEFILSGLVDHKEELPTPWKSIVTSLPLWALIVVSIGQGWGFWTVLTEIPSYMNSIMNYNLSENGLLSAIPYLLYWLANFIYSPLADFLIVKEHLSIVNVRRLFTTIGFALPAICLITLSFIDTDQKEVAVALLTLSQGFNSAVYPGFQVNHIDIARNHAGVLMGITNSIGMIPSIIVPYVIDIIGKDESDPILWRYVFCISAGVFLATNLFFVMFASGETQEWNEPMPNACHKDKQELDEKISKDF